MTSTPTHDTLLTTINPAAKVTAARPTVFAAVQHADDRLDRLENTLGDLNGVIKRAGAQLAPILTGGTYADQDPRRPDATDPPLRGAVPARRQHHGPRDPCGPARRLRGPHRP
jgi:hypothetical protein